MRKILVTGVLGLVVGLFSFASNSRAVLEVKGFPFNVYTDQWDGGNNYIPSGWMGDYGAIKVDPAWKNEPHSGKSCIKWTYTGEIPQGAGWAGVYWQNPANNWGRVDGGFNLSGAKKLTFWARGEKGGEIVEFKMGGINGEFADSDSNSTGRVELTKEWKQYSIDLAGLDLSYISGGFVWVASKIDNPDGFVFYLDDIRYE